MLCCGKIKVTTQPTKNIKITAWITSVTIELLNPPSTVYPKVIAVNRIAEIINSLLPAFP